MTLLIVEDEVVTRENLGAMLDYRKLGFTDVYMAADGAEGLAKAKKYNPDVVLTDIRMPGMDGIEMAEAIRKQFPRCQIIFLSAYEELEYYKAAIRLKTTSYVEKPVMSAKLERVLKDAAGESQQQNRLEWIQSREKLVKRKPLAYSMTFPNQRKNELKFMEEEGEQELEKYRNVTTVLLSLKSPLNNEEDIMSEIADWIHSYGEEFLYTVNSENCYILQLMTKEKHYSFVHMVEEKLCSKVKDRNDWYISLGETVPAGKSFQSYQSAVLGMQKSFFEPYGFVAYPAKDEIGAETQDDCRKERIEILVTIGNFNIEDSLKLEEALFQKLEHQKSMASGKVREMYYDFFEAFFHECEQRQMPLEGLEEYRQLIRKGDTDRLNCCELHETFIRIMQLADKMLKEQEGEYSLISIIKKYVEDNYEDQQFSLIEVAEYAHLSVSYICVVFKAHTGMTINHYLTEVRMNKAQKYLLSTRYSLAEISHMVGYQDSNYFGRIFKKTFHLTPVEYRECKGKMADG